MKRHLPVLLVLIGVFIVVGSSLLLPLTSTGQKIYGMDPYKTMQLHLHEASGVTIGISSLLVLPVKRQWRGVIWIVIGTVGALWTYFYASALIVFSTPVISRIGEAGEPLPSHVNFEIGLSVTLVGYALIVVGGIWDILRKRKSPGNQNVPEKSMTT